MSKNGEVKTTEPERRNVSVPRITRIGFSGKKGGGFLEVDAAALPQSAIDFGWRYGFGQILRDSGSGEKGEAAKALAEKRLAALMAGTIRSHGPRTDGIVTEALAMIGAALRTAGMVGKDVADRITMARKEEDPIAALALVLAVKRAKPGTALPEIAKRASAIAADARKRAAENIARRSAPGLGMEDDTE